MNGHLVPLITPWRCQRLDSLRFLQVVLQEAILHQFVQLVSECQAVTYGVAIRLVELAPHVLVRPQPLVSFRGHLQSLRYVGNNDQLL